MFFRSSRAADKKADSADIDDDLEMRNKSHPDNEPHQQHHSATPSTLTSDSSKERETQSLLLPALAETGGVVLKARIKNTTITSTTFCTPALLVYKTAAKIC
jgi:hypothetical protein